MRSHGAAIGQGTSLSQTARRHFLTKAPANDDILCAHMMPWLAGPLPFLWLHDAIFERRRRRRKIFNNRLRYLDVLQRGFTYSKWQHKHGTMPLVHFTATWTRGSTVNLRCGVIFHGPLKQVCSSLSGLRHWPAHRCKSTPHHCLKTVFFQNGHASSVFTEKLGTIINACVFGRVCVCVFRSLCKITYRCWWLETLSFRHLCFRVRDVTNFHRRFEEPFHRSLIVRL